MKKSSAIQSSLFLLAAFLLVPIPALAQFSYFINSGDGSITINGYSGPGGAITIPTNIDGYLVTGIAQDAFFARSGLTGVTIPNSVTGIGQDAFSNCSLTNISVVGDNPAYSSLGGVLFDKPQVTLIQFPQALTGSYLIPNSVKRIGNHAFEACGLTSATIPDSVTNIPNGGSDYFGQIGAFLYCNSLTNITVAGNNPAYSSSSGALFDKAQVTLVQFPAALTGSYVFPATVTSLGNDALAFSSLSSVTLPNGLTRLGAEVFRNCTNLTSMTIPNNVTNIGSAAFYYCISLTNVVIGNRVASIGDTAFNCCFSLANVTLPNSVTSIGQIAFNYCSSLTSVTIPNSVTNIGRQAFGNCAGLTNVVIGNSVTTIPSSMFYNCTKLPGVIIPNSVTSIQNNAFQYCYSLTNITVAGSNLAYSSLGGVLFDKAQATLIQFPEGLTGGYAIPASVTSIGYHAFAFSSPTSVVIPQSVTNIADYAFVVCASLTNLYFQGNAPNLGVNVFNGVNASAIVYYLYGTTGWGATYGGLPTVLLNPPISSGSISVGANGFGFSIPGSSNQVVVIEASTNLVNWQPIQTNILTGTSANFTDSQWTNYLQRFYRIRSP